MLQLLLQAERLLIPMPFIIQHCCYGYTNTQPYLPEPNLLHFHNTALLLQNNNTQHYLPEPNLRTHFHKDGTSTATDLQHTTHNTLPH